MRGALSWTAAALLLLLAGCGGTKESAPKTEDAGARTEDAGTREASAKRDGPEVVGETMILVVDPPAGLAKMKPEELVSLEARQREAQALDLELYAARGEENPRIKGMIEQILLNDAGIPRSIRRKLEDYARLMWLNKGVEDLRTGDRLRPRFIPGELAAAANIALANGAAIDMPKAAGKSLEANRIEELEGLLAIVRPEIFGPMRGTQDAGPGAVPSAKGGEDEGERRPTSRERGDVVILPDGKLDPMLSKLWDDSAALIRSVRKVGGVKSTAPEGPGKRIRASEVLVAAGTEGDPRPIESELLWRGPMVESGGEVHFLSNVDKAFDAAVGDPLTDAVLGGPREPGDMSNERLRALLAAFSSIAGGGADGTGKKPSDWMSDRLGEHFRVVSELRRELAAVYLLRDESVRRAGFFEEGEAPEALCEAYVRHAAITWILGEQSAPLPAARAAILGHLAVAGAVSVTLGDDGRAAVTLEDKAAFERSIERQLAEIRRIRFVGDRAGAGRFLDEGRAGLAQKVLRAAKKSVRDLELTRYVAFIYLSLGKDGTPVSKPGSFAEHQLRLAATGPRGDPYGELGSARAR